MVVYGYELNNTLYYKMILYVIQQEMKYRFLRVTAIDCASVCTLNYNVIC